MATTIVIPDFDFTGFYYPEIYEALILYKRRNLPELSDESDQEPLIQLLRAFALTAHLNNVLIDLIANESTLPTAQLADTIRNMLRLIDYEMRSATPAGVDMVYKLSRTFSSTGDVIVPILAQAATRRGDGDTEIVPFESDAEVSITQRTDQVGIVWSTTGEPLTPVGVDNTADAIAGTPFSAWATAVVGNMFYVGHPDVMFDEVAISIDSSANEISIGVWEYHDGTTLDAKPDSVVNAGGSQLRIGLGTLLGAANRAGAQVSVQLDSTTATEVAASLWDGSENYCLVSLLGQSSPSLSTDDYTVGVEWAELDNQVDGSANLSVTGDLTFTLPQSTARNWTKVTPPDGTVEGFYIRFRVVETIGTGAPSIDGINIDGGGQFVTAPATQGQSVIAETLGSSNGDVDQSFQSGQVEAIQGTVVVRVDAAAWTQVSNFISSGPASEHFRVELTTDNRAVVVFGDGVKGKIPPVGQGNIEADYRHNATADGNVGALAIEVDKQGLTFVESLYNPRQATGWSAAQDSSAAALEGAKEEGPAALRNKSVALTPPDAEDLALAFTSSNGSRPFGRAKAVESGFGPKTLKLVVVAKGGGLATAAQIAASDEYFNGVDGDSTKPKRLVTNQELGTVNYTPRPVSVTATVHGPSDVTPTQIKNALAAILQPEALQSDGVSWLWNFGGEVSLSQLTHEIHEVDDRITKVVMSAPSAAIQLSALELPTTGTLTITIVS